MSLFEILALFMAPVFIVVVITWGISRPEPKQDLFATKPNQKGLDQCH